MRESPDYYNVYGDELYDSSCILPSKMEEISSALHKYLIINNEFKIAREYLGKIKIEMEQDKQLELIHSFLKERK